MAYLSQLTFCKTIFMCHVFVAHVFMICEWNGETGFVNRVQTSLSIVAHLAAFSFDYTTTLLWCLSFIE